MPTSSIFHGIQTNVMTSDASAITSVATAVIGLVATGTDADVTMFPLNTPVLVNDARAALAKAGTQGTLATALAAIADQCSPLVIVVRVDTNASGQDALTEAGLQALLTAEQVTTYRPRILGAPGLTTHATT